MLLDIKELEDSSKMHPEVKEFIENNPQPPIDWSDWEGVRAGMAMMGQMQAAQIGPPNPDVLTEEYKDITLRDGFKSTLKIHKPVHPPSKGSPLILFAFGGGFIAGDKDQGTAMARMFVKAFGAVFVSISYRLAPENKFPCQQLDGWDVVKWCAEHASELGADPKQGFVMSGISAGGNVASAVVTKAIEEPLAHPFTGQYLGIPAILDKDHTPEKYRKYHLSLEHNTSAPILQTDSMQHIEKHAQTDKESPLRFPVNAKAPLSKQPKAYIMADGMDPLRDDALIWDEMLKEAGVETKIDFYPGCPHGHWAFMPGIGVSNKAIGDLVVGFGWLLGDNLSVEEAMKRAL